MSQNYEKTGSLKVDFKKIVFLFLLSNFFVFFVSKLNFYNKPGYKAIIQNDSVVYTSVLSCLF